MDIIYNKSWAKRSEDDKMKKEQEEVCDSATQNNLHFGPIFESL